MAQQQTAGGHPSDRRGKLYLIGAGPGDPDLLTVKAARVLAACDVVLYDRLVSKEVLRLVRPGALSLYVGKHEGEQDRVQNQIFRLIEEHALAGRSVVRLKGGDPLVFGRGAEEWMLAGSHGIEVELVPGVSSAIAVPGLAGIPLTYRGVSQSFAVVTAHCHGGPAEEWTRVAGVNTLVVMMGVLRRVHISRALIEAGRPADEPVAFVERGSTDRERVVESTLAEVASGTVEVESPAVLVIGQVVRLRSQLISGSVPAPPASEDQAQRAASLEASAPAPFQKP